MYDAMFSFRPAMIYSTVILVILFQSFTAAPTSTPCITGVHCDFDHIIVKPFCGFTPGQTHEWKRINSLKLPHNGRLKDASNTGYFLRVAGHQQDQMVTLTSPQFCTNQTVCVSIMYWQNGTSQNSLSIHLNNATVMHVPTTFQNAWTGINMTFHVKRNEKISFHAKIVSSDVILALDDINITNGSCREFTSIHEMSTVRGVPDQTSVLNTRHDTATPLNTTYTTTLLGKTYTTSSPYPQSTTGTLKLLVEQILDSTITLTDQNEACIHFNTHESESLLIENDILLKIRRIVHIYPSNLQNKQLNLHAIQTLTNTDQALLMNEQNMMVATAKQLITNTGDTRLNLLQRQLDFIEDQMSLLQDLQKQLVKNNAESSLRLQERTLLHREPELFRVDDTSLSPGEQLQHQAAVLQLQATLLHNDAILTQISHNTTTCLDQEMIIVLSLRESVLRYKRNLSLFP
ncbi:uncharacterized protein LOC125378624 isoform X2 [Haliotis rufescens]|uniref:uncharacterized protein LOC125378624 isoform X2 n=1 Tax=Haliotis rufescens TaxID=6454 RepID=UPI00201F9163|nr:uncharacterized protein LOC125378624 isoform X2 [Haliotis rufescens]